MIGEFEIGSFCNSAKEILRFVGWLLTLFKVAIPLIIIAYGMLDLGKAVVASKDDEIKTGAKRLLFRALAGIFIFFVPTLVIWLFSTITDYESAREGFDSCESAILRPWEK